MKGQITIQNLVYLAVFWMIFFVVFLPIWSVISPIGISYLDPASQFYTIEVLLIQIIPTITIVAGTLGILNYSQPKYDFTPG